MARRLSPSSAYPDDEYNMLTCLSQSSRRSSSSRHPRPHNQSSCRQETYLLAPANQPTRPSWNTLLPSLCHLPPARAPMGWRNLRLVQRAHHRPLRPIRLAYARLHRRPVQESRHRNHQPAYHQATQYSPRYHLCLLRRWLHDNSHVFHSHLVSSHRGRLSSTIRHPSSAYGPLSRASCHRFGCHNYQNRLVQPLHDRLFGLDGHRHRADYHLACRHLRG